MYQIHIAVLHKTLLRKKSLALEENMVCWSLLIAAFSASNFSDLGAEEVADLLLSPELPLSALPVDLSLVSSTHIKR